MNLLLFLDPYHMLMLHDVVSVFRYFNLNYHVKFDGFCLLSHDLSGYINLEKYHLNRKILIFLILYKIRNR